MSDIILIPIVAFVGFVIGAAWMYRIGMRAVDEAIDEYAADLLAVDICPTCRRPLTKPHRHGVLYLPPPTGPRPPSPPMPPRNRTVA